MKNVIIYSTPTCHYCTLAKDFFLENNVPYTEYDVATDVKKRKEMVDKTGQLGVPVIEIDGQTMVGFNEEVIAKALGIQA
jgi:glutaredoxin 3